MIILTLLNILDEPSENKIKFIFNNDYYYTLTPTIYLG